MKLIGKTIIANWGDEASCAPTKILATEGHWIKVERANGKSAWWNLEQIHQLEFVEDNKT